MRLNDAARGLKKTLPVLYDVSLTRSEASFHTLADTPLSLQKP